MAKPTVLITGVSGFIARHCAVEMLNAGYVVRGTVRSIHKSDEVKASLAKHADVTRLEFAVADLESDDGWGRPPRVARTCCTSPRRFRRGNRRTSRT